MLNVFGEETSVEMEEEEFRASPNPKLFDWMTSVNKSKVDLRFKSVSGTVGPDPMLKGYEPFIINKGIGQSIGTIGFANICCVG